MSVSVQQWHDVRTGEILKVILHPGFFSMDLKEQIKSIREINKWEAPVPEDKILPAREPREMYSDEELQELYKAGYIGYLQTCSMDITPHLKKIGIIKEK